MATRGQRRRHSLQTAKEAASARSVFSLQEQAAIRFALSLLQGKWKIGILCRLQEGPVRLAELRRLFPQASKKMLIQRLREMERDELIVRADLGGKVPHVEYSLSKPRGQSASRLLDLLATWSAEYPPQVSSAKEIEFLDSGSVIQ
ncbi:MAG: winged helix-turn-helix transcriptional regulator [Acidobacteriaceae bacterium]